MDLEEWEVLSHEGFLDYHEDVGGGGGKIRSLSSTKPNSNPKTVFKVDHFICPSSSPPRNSRFVPVPIQLEPPNSGKQDDDDEVKFTELGLVPNKAVIMPEMVKSCDSGSADQDPVSQVFFKKMKENEFVDMILDSPRSCTKANNFVPPQIEFDAAAKFNFEDKTDPFSGEAMAMETTKISSPRIKKEQEIVKEVSWEEEEENGGGVNLWKWSLTGIGAICSFGVAAATICIIIFGSHQRNKQQQHNNNQKLRFQIYTDDKQRIKQVVHQAAKLNEAMSAVRGVPISRAQITIGGYYDGL